MKREVRIFKDLEGLSQAAAELFTKQAHSAVQARGRFLAVLNGGNTPLPLFHLLAARHRDDVDWSRTHLFWGDERCVPPADPGSNFGQAQKAFLEPLGLREQNLHRIRGEMSPAEAAQDYALLLKRFAEPPLAWPRFDLVLLGLGEDGHTASLFPGSPLEASGPVQAVTAQYQDRPAERVSLTPPVLNSARLILFMVSGRAKADALGRVLGSVRDPLELPAQRVEPKNGRLVWLVDESAAAQLPK